MTREEQGLQEGFLRPAESARGELRCYVDDDFVLTMGAIRAFDAPDRLGEVVLAVDGARLGV